MTLRLTLAVVTRNRPKKLKRCLESIAMQTVPPDYVIVVDNDVGKSARSTCNAFNKLLPLIYLVEKKQGIPIARNKVLNSCKTPLIAFTDDDCVLERKWVEEAKKAISDNHETFVLGKSELLNKESIFANAIFYRQDYWFNFELKRGRGNPTPYNLDTKNIVVKVADLRNKKIFFDQKLFLHTTGGHADTDLGFQLKMKGLTGKYQSKMVVYHEEVNTLLGYLKKAYYRGKVGYLLADKWGLKNEVVFLPDLKLIKWFKRLKTWSNDFRLWMKRVKYPTLHKIIIFLLIKFYDRLYLQGFADQARNLGKKDTINRLIAIDKR